MPSYIQQIANHSEANGLLMLRIFSNSGQSKDYFIDEINGQKSKVTLFSREKIDSLYSEYFEIIQFNRSKPRVQDHLCFDEYLMRRKLNVQ